MDEMKAKALWESMEQIHLYNKTLTYHSAKCCHHFALLTMFCNYLGN